MDIIFEVGNKQYRLKSGSYDLTLQTYMLEYQDKEGNVYDEPKEKTSDIGFFKNEFQALNYLVDHVALNSDAETLLDQAKFRQQTLKEIKEIAEQFRIK